MKYLLKRVDELTVSINAMHKDVREMKKSNDLNMQKMYDVGQYCGNDLSPVELKEIIKIMLNGE